MVYRTVLTVSTNSSLVLHPHQFFPSYVCKFSFIILLDESSCKLEYKNRLIIVFGLCNFG